jgi:hypothetical protein
MRSKRPRLDISKPGFVRCVSLWNPHATLVVTGEKKLETRGGRGNVHIRGRLLIHSSLTREWEWMHQMPMFREALKRHGYEGTLDYGYVIGSVDLTDCRPVESVRGYISRQESVFGNYEDGRFAWKLENPVRFAEPIRFQGHQGFFWVPEEILPNSAL